MARRAVLSYPYGTARTTKKALPIRQLYHKRGGFLRYALISRGACFYAAAALFRRRGAKETEPGTAGELYISRHYVDLDRHRHHRHCVLSAAAKQTKETPHEAGQFLSAAQHAVCPLGFDQRDQLFGRDDSVFRVCLSARFSNADRRDGRAVCIVSALRPKPGYPAGQYPVFYRDRINRALYACGADRSARAQKELHHLSTGARTDVSRGHHPLWRREFAQSNPAARGVAGAGRRHAESREQAGAKADTQTLFQPRTKEQGRRKGTHQVS